MIFIVTGSPGSGKSMYSLEVALFDYLLSGKTVYTNHPLKVGWEAVLAHRYGRGNWVVEDRLESNMRGYRERWTVIRSLDEIPKDRAVEGSRLLLLDECNRFLNSRGKIAPEYFSFFTQHRKMGYDIILMSHKAEQIDKQLRELAETLVVVRNLATFRIPLFLTSIKIPWKILLVIRKDNRSTVVFDRELRPVNKLVGRMYDTGALFTEFYFSGTSDLCPSIQPTEAEIEEFVLTPQKEISDYAVTGGSVYESVITDYLEVLSGCH